MSLNLKKCFCLVLVFQFFLAGCSDFFNGTQLKDDLESKIEYESSESVLVSVRTNDPDAGAFVIGGGDFNKKVSDTITVDFSLKSNYKIVKWVVEDRDGNDLSGLEDSPVKITDLNKSDDDEKKDENKVVDSSKIEIKLLRPVSVVVKVICYEKPSVNENSISPKYIEDGVSKGNPIIIPFNRDMRGNDLSKIEIKIDNVVDNEVYSTRLFYNNGKEIRIFPDNSKQEDFTAGRRKVLITIPENFSYFVGGKEIKMGEAFTHSFLINSTIISDTIAPEFENFVVKTSNLQKELIENQSLEKELNDRGFSGYKLWDITDENAKLEIRDKFVTGSYITFNFTVNDDDSGLKCLNVKESLLGSALDGTAGDVRNISIYPNQFSNEVSTKYEVKDYKYNISSPVMGYYELEFEFEDWVGNKASAGKYYIITDTSFEDKHILIDAHNIDINPYFVFINKNSRDYSYYHSRAVILNMLSEYSKSDFYINADTDSGQGVSAETIKNFSNNFYANALNIHEKAIIDLQFYTYDKWYYNCYSYSNSLKNYIRWGESRNSDGNLENVKYGESKVYEQNELLNVYYNTYSSSNGDSCYLQTNKYNIEEIDSTKDILVDVCLEDSAGNVAKVTHFIPASPEIYSYSYSKEDKTLTINTSSTCPAELQGKYILYQVLYYSDNQDTNFKRALEYDYDEPVKGGNGTFRNINFTGDKGYFYVQTFAYYDNRYSCGSIYSINDKNYISGRLSKLCSVDVNSEKPQTVEPEISASNFKIDIEPGNNNDHIITVSFVENESADFSSFDSVWVKAVKNKKILTKTDDSFSFTLPTKDIYGKEFNFSAGVEKNGCLKEIDLSISNSDERVKDNVKPYFDIPVEYENSYKDAKSNLIKILIDDKNDCSYSLNFDGRPKDDVGGLEESGFDLTVYFVPLLQKWDNGHTVDSNSASTLISEGYMTESDIINNSVFSIVRTVTKSDSSITIDNISQFANNKYIICMKVKDKAGNEIIQPCFYLNCTSAVTSDLMEQKKINEMQPSMYFMPSSEWDDYLSEWKEENPVVKDNLSGLHIFGSSYVVSGCIWNEAENKWTDFSDSILSKPYTWEMRIGTNDIIIYSMTNVLFNTNTDCFIKLYFKNTITAGNFSGPFYVYVKDGKCVECDNKNYVIGATNPVAYADNPVFIEVLYSDVDYGTDPDVWNKWVPESQKNGQKVWKTFTDSSFSYKVDYEKIPYGKYYTVMMHFSDGSCLMTPVKQKDSY